MRIAKTIHTLIKYTGILFILCCLMGPKVFMEHEHHTEHEQTPHSDEEDCAQCQYYFSTFFVPEATGTPCLLVQKESHYSGFDAQLSNVSLSFYTGLAPPRV